jgi:hypothetical protein
MNTLPKLQRDLHPSENGGGDASGEQVREEKKLSKGCVVYMNSKSGCIGYGNPQCVKDVCEPLGEISLYGHNQHYKIYDIERIVEYPLAPAAPLGEDEIEKNVKELLLFCEKDGWVKNGYRTLEIINKLRELTALKASKE